MIQSNGVTIQSVRGGPEVGADNRKALTAAADLLKKKNSKY